MKRVKVGVIGCGNISAKYLHSLTEVFKHVEVVAVTDLLRGNAELRARQFGIDCVCGSMEKLIAMDEVEIAIILTAPGQHFAVAKASLAAKKHTYIEKPLSLHIDDGAKLLAIAHENGVMVSGAPDTILGAGIQTAKKLIDDGWIGKPIAAISHILTGGPESWHPNPAFLYHKGAGPLFDVAPYYVAGLTYLLGPVSSVMCSSKKTWERRPITSQPLYGAMIDVEVPTYLVGILTMDNGVLCTIHHSFDVSHTKLDNSVEIYGTNGTLVVPTPCSFSGDLLYRGNQDAEWSRISPLFPYRSDCRGIGVADMAEALLQNRAPRISAEFVYHTLEVLQQLETSAAHNQSRAVESRFSGTPLMDSSPTWGPDKEWNPEHYGIPAH